MRKKTTLSKKQSHSIHFKSKHAFLWFSIFSVLHFNSGNINVVAKAASASAAIKPPQPSRIKNELIPVMPTQNTIENNNPHQLKQHQQKNLGSKTNFSIQNIQKTRNQLKRKQILTIFLLRICFIFLLPITLITTALSLLPTLLFTTLRILTLNLTNRDTTKLSFILLRTNLSLIMASIIGILHPIFSIFGICATLSVSIMECMEPLLRIKYQREIKRLRHLHRLLTDPVLMDTMTQLVKGAKYVSSWTVQETKQGVKRIGNQAHLSVESSKELVDLVIESSGMAQMLQQTFQNPTSKDLSSLSSSSSDNTINNDNNRRGRIQISPQLWNWGNDQYQALRKSGILEEAAKHAMGALSKELESVKGFLPYLEALEYVRLKQEQLKQEERKKMEKMEKKQKQQKQKQR